MMDQARGPARSVQLIDQTLALSLPGIAVVGNDLKAGIPIRRSWNPSCSSRPTLVEPMRLQLRFSQSKAYDLLASRELTR